MFDTVLARGKRQYKVIVYKDDIVKRKYFFPTYKMAKKRALRTGHPVLDAVLSTSYVKRGKRKRKKH